MERREDGEEVEKEAAVVGSVYALAEDERGGVGEIGGGEQLGVGGGGGVGAEGGRGGGGEGGRDVSDLFDVCGDYVALQCYFGVWE